MNVPQLRFDGFEGEWEKILFKDIFFEKTERTNDMNQYPLFSLTVEKGVTPKTDRYERSFLVKEGNDNYKIVNPDDFVYNPMNLTLGAVAKHKKDSNISVSGYYNVFSTNPKFNSDFLEMYLKSYKMILHYKAIATGSLIEKQRVHFSQFVNIKRPLPSLKEQNKIGSFFAKLDQRIEKQQEKLEKLEQFKKGMMQKIFSQELRFKDEDGGEFSEWEKVALSDLGATYTGLSGKTKEDFGHGEASFVTYVNVFNNLKASIDGLQAVDLSNGKKQNSVRLGDILFTTSSETPHEVGMASYWAFDQEDVYLNSFCFGFRLMNDLTDGEFLTYLLRSPIYRAVITLLAQGSTRYNISKAGLMKMKVFIPSRDEQRKIVSVLSQIDAKLEKEKEKLLVLKEQKKGFMQGMFV